MTESAGGQLQAVSEDDEISLLALASVLLRWRRTLLWLGVAGAAVGLAAALTEPRRYVSAATFVPEHAETGSSGLAIAASQLGINIQQPTGNWGPAMYAALIRSRDLLQPVALDTLVVAEEGGRRIALMDLLEVRAATLDGAIAGAVAELARMITAREDAKLGGVTLSVATRWPSVSLALANRLVERVNQFNLDTRKTQAAAERGFVDAQAEQSGRELHAAEDSLLRFLQRNRDIGDSPSLMFERDRLTREVARRSALYTSWLQSEETARIREVRNTPVITVLEQPRLPLGAQPRRLTLKAVVGAIVGAMLGAVLALLADAVRGARRSEQHDAREFFALLEQAAPSFLRRRRSGARG